MKIISLREFILKIERAKEYPIGTRYFKVYEYTKFLGRKLEMWMFHPVDDINRIMKEPTDYDFWLKGNFNHNANKNWQNKCEQYQKALKKVLFKGGVYVDRQPSRSYNSYDIGDKKIFYDANTSFNNSCGLIVEDLAGLGVALTENGIKKFKKLFLCC